MKIIDVHSHLAYSKVYSEDFYLNMINGINIPKDKKKRLMQALVNDENGESLIRQMDENEIEQTILLIIDTEFQYNSVKYSIEEIFDIHSKIKARYPKRISVFAGIDPRRGEKGFQLFKKSVEEFEFSGLKLYPPMGFPVGDDRLIPFYEYCSEKNLPIIIHTGPSLPTLKNDFSEPLVIIDALSKFPNVKFVLAHLGCMLSKEIVDKIISHKNIYADISGFQKIIHHGIEQNTKEYIKLWLQPELNEKLLFGLDFPLFNLFSSVKSDIQSLLIYFPEKDNPNIEKAIANLFYNNAKSLLLY